MNEVFIRRCLTSVMLVSFASGIECFSLMTYRSSSVQQERCQSQLSSAVNLHEDLGPVKDRDEHLRYLDQSFKMYTDGKGIMDFLEEDVNDVQRQLSDIQTSTRYALMSHGAIHGMNGPMINYANFGALLAFQLSFNEMTEKSACQVANPGLDQANWSQALQTIQSRGKLGFAENYNGFRCTGDQTPFYIRGAMVIPSLVFVALLILPQKSVKLSHATSFSL